MAEWRPIPDCDYEASDEGQIRRSIPAKRKRVYPITGFTAPTGYVMACLQINGKQKNVLVHRMVCAAFHGPQPSPDHEVAHRTGKRGDNRQENLRWATPAENNADKVFHGTAQHGEKNGSAKLTEADIPHISRRANEGQGQREIAAHFGVHQRQICNVLHKRSWSHISEPLELHYPMRQAPGGARAGGQP